MHPPHLAKKEKLQELAQLKPAHPEAEAGVPKTGIAGPPDLEAEAPREAATPPEVPEAEATTAAAPEAAPRAAPGTPAVLAARPTVTN